MDKFTLIAKDTIQDIELYGKSLRLIIEDEVVLSVLIEIAKKQGIEITSSKYFLSKAVFNKADNKSYQDINDSLNALKTGVNQIGKNDKSFIFSFIDALAFDDNLNEKGKIKIRLSKEIYDFFTKENKYLIAFDIKNYRRLTGGRIQKLLYFYFLSVNLTMPTPLVKIKEILKLNQKLKDFKKSFTDNLINVLAAEGVYIKIKGDDLIYHRKHRRMIAVKSVQSDGRDTEPKQINHNVNLEKFNFDELKLNKSFVIALCKIYSENNVIKALEKMQYIKKKQEIKNPAGFLKNMLTDGTYADAGEIKEKQKKHEENKNLQILKPHKLTIEEEEEAQRQVNKSIEEKIKEFEKGEPNYENN